LLRQGLHTAEILEGYKRAFEKCMEELPSLVCHTVEDVRDKAQLVYAIKTTLASKQYGFEVSALTHCYAATTTHLFCRTAAVSAAANTDCLTSSCLMLSKLKREERIAVTAVVSYIQCYCCVARYAHVLQCLYIVYN
jgi:hypothetical protein